MVKANIYQIYYSEITKSQNDEGFLPLDNLANPRPDWREYWPIRNFLLEARLESDTYYGFLSPKFKQKTHLTSADVFAFVGNSDADVITFSPFFDQSAFPINIFEQAISQHSGIFPVLEEAFRPFAPELNLSTLIMTSRSTVFCNYFLAKKSFWDSWLSHCERVFSTAEENDSPLALRLNASTNHDGGLTPNKVFVIERIVSFLLATNPQWKVKTYNPMQLPYASSPVARYTDDLCILNALKVAYTENGFLENLHAFNRVRQGILEKIQAQGASLNDGT